MKVNTRSRATRSRTAVLAGNFRQFQDYLRTHKLNPYEFFYVYDERSLAGWHGEILEVGTYWENPMYNSDYFQGWKVLQQIIRPEQDIEKEWDK